MAKRYYWLKLNRDFFDSMRMRKLRSIAGGAEYMIIYLKLLLYAIDKDGVLEYQGIENNISEELSLVIDEEPENIGLCINYLRTVGLAEIKSEAVFLPEAVEKVGSETASTQRVRDFRQRQKEVEALHCNADVTKCNTDVTQVKRLCNVEKEKELEIEKETDTEKSKRKIFVPPTIEEVSQYCSENTFAVNAEKFVDYYTANGWVVGKTKMKDWKATVRGWHRREQERFQNNKKGEEYHLPFE